MASASSKEQLHTLVEEEEEEEEVPATVVSSPVQESPAVQEIPAQETSVREVPEDVPVTSPSARHRPASLNLRPLSLAQMATSDLPTPVLTPSPSARPGLRSLTLGSSPAGANKRQSLILTQSPSPMSNTFARRSSLNIDRQASAPLPQPFLAGNKRTSIPYVSSTDTPPQSVIGLPTPEMTPTTAERPLSSPDAGAEAGTGGGAGEDPSQILATRPARPLSVSEQHFLFQAHATLVQRITDLERALSTSRSSRSWSRSMSCASEASMASTVSMSAASEPNDEMLQLLADLKAERDELRLDVDGWRARVADLEHQVGMYAKRVEAERRDAWVARERVGLLEAEKGNLEKFLNDKVAEAETLQEQVERAKEETRRVAAENERLKSEMDRMLSFEEECARLKEALYAERNKREDLEKDLEHAGLLNTPRAFDSVIPQIPAAISRSMFAKARGLGFQSIDSESSVTDVDSVDSPRDKHEFGLNAVAEEDEETLSSFSEEDELARFEDEEEGDEYAFPMSMSASSFGSADDNVQLTPNAQSGNVEVEQPPSLTRANTSSPTSLPTPVEQTHARRASLQKAWSFSTASTSVVGQSEEIDRFFGCLEDVDNSPPLNSVLRSVESDKNLFSQALANDEGEDELPPFVLPADVGVEVVSPPLAEEPRRPLDVVVEEVEEEETREDETKEQGPDDEFVGEIDEGGIKFTFTIPPDFQVATEPEPVESLESVSTPQAMPSAPVVMNPFEEEDSSFTFPQSRSQQNSSPTPSAIPRLVQSRSSAALGSNSSSSPIRSSPRSSPSKLPSPSSTPTKRSTPSFIPQPRGKSPAHGANMVSFIPQPRRSPSPASYKSSAIPIVSPPSTPFPKPLSSVCI
ncbi:hypothetical protein WOLCODRAFT_24853 [Wolfiporia cocos MD-104 SS10]|uniref:Uncharacterized protein n=1 Tax=Wolfiporia cocos (strain MD-104) TaxID=742152 RepID=A0A2H3JI85_WOLCO|nr:hypothetical protein WOLCODRAFT_24853 [Wolfiporia cocos MD-104 SS10]